MSQHLLASLLQYLLFRIICIVLIIYQSTASTIISNTWYDDFAYDTSAINGWHVYNFISVNESKYYTPDANRITIGNNGKKYHGPFSKLPGGTRANYLQREFICNGSINNLNRIYLQYKFAYCNTDVSDFTKLCKLNSNIELNELGNDVCSSGQQTNDPMSINNSYPFTDTAFVSNSYLITGCNISEWRFQNQTQEMTNDDLVFTNDNFSISIKQSVNLGEYSVLYDVNIICVPLINTTSPTTSNPTQQTSNPTNHPITNIPTINPTINPSIYPTTNPSVSPTLQPSHNPTTTNPTVYPTRNPITATPTMQPITSAPTTITPTIFPSNNPSITPTNNPSNTPTITSSIPTKNPTITPTISPTETPSNNPTIIPTITPTETPSFHPTITPSNIPSNIPSITPTNNPSIAPTKSPTETGQTQSPTVNPTILPSNIPSISPTTNTPTTMQPTVNPSMTPTANPTTTPSTNPSIMPTTQPSKYPSRSPITHNPTNNPITSNPTQYPITVAPTLNPTINPTIQPTENPTIIPTIQPITVAPTIYPTIQPTDNPVTDIPTIQPTHNPTVIPTYVPTITPMTNSPSNTPTIIHQSTTQTTINISGQDVIFIKQIPKYDTIISNPFDRFITMNNFYIQSVYNVDPNCYECFQWNINNIIVDNDESVTVYNVKTDSIIFDDIQYDIFESYLIIHSINYGHTNNNNNNLYCFDEYDEEISNHHILQFGNDYNIILKVFYNDYLNFAQSTNLKIKTNKPPSDGYCEIDNTDTLEVLSTFNLQCFNWKSNSDTNLTYNAVFDNGVLMSNKFVSITSQISSITPVGDFQINVIIKDSFDSVTCYKINASFPSITDAFNNSTNITKSVNNLVNSIDNIVSTTNLAENNNIAISLYSVINNMLSYNNLSNTIPLSMLQSSTGSIIRNIFGSSLYIHENVTSDMMSSELSVLDAVTSNPQLITQDIISLFIDDYIPLTFDAFNTYINYNSHTRRRRRRMLSNEDDEDNMNSIANTLEILVNKLQMILLNIEIATPNNHSIIEHTNIQNDMLIEYALNGIHIALSDSFPGEMYSNIISNIASNISKILNGVKFENINNTNNTNNTITCGLQTENIIIPITFSSENIGIYDCSFIKSEVNNFIPSDVVTITNDSSSYLPASNVVAINLYSDHSDLVAMEYKTDACDPYLINIIATDSNILSAFDDYNKYNGFKLDEKTQFPKCNFWDNSSSTWSDYGCWLYNISLDNNMITCSCVHLSTFQVSSDDFVPKANVLSVWHFRAFTMDNLLKYPTVWITIVSLFVIVLSLCVCSTYHERDNTAILAFEDIVFRQVRNEKLKTSEIGREIDCMVKYIPNKKYLGGGLLALAQGKNAKKSLCKLSYGLYRIHLFNEHTFLSLFLKAEGTNFSSIQRLGCFFMYLATVIVGSGMVYGVEQNNICGDISASFYISLFGTLPVMIAKQLFLNSKPKIVPRTIHVKNENDNDDNNKQRKSFKLKKFQTAIDLTNNFKLQRTLSTKVKMVNSVRLTLFNDMYPLSQNWKIYAWIFLIVWTICVCFVAVQFGLEFDLKYDREKTGSDSDLFDNDCWQNNQKLIIENTLSNWQFTELNNALDEDNDYGDNYDKLLESLQIKSESIRWLISCFQSVLLSIFLWQPLTIYFVTWLKIFAFSWNLQMQLGPKTIIGIIKRCCRCNICGVTTSDEQGLKECLTPPNIDNDNDNDNTYGNANSNSTYSVFAHQNRPLDLIGYISNDQLFTDIDPQKEEEKKEKEDSFSLSLSLSEEIRKATIRANMIHISDIQMSNMLNINIPNIKPHLEIIPTQSHDGKLYNDEKSDKNDEKDNDIISIDCNDEKDDDINDINSIYCNDEKDDEDDIDSMLINEAIQVIDFSVNETPTIVTPGSINIPRCETFGVMTEHQLAEILDVQQDMKENMQDKEPEISILESQTICSNTSTMESIIDIAQMMDMNTNAQAL